MRERARGKIDREGNTRKDVHIITYKYICTYILIYKGEKGERKIL